MNKFVIACLARTGSYRLTDILNQQEGVVCHGEIFKNNKIEVEDKYLEEISLKRSDVKKRDSDPASFIDKLFGAVKSESNIASGFKIFPGHNKDALDYCLAEKDFSVIFLCRNPFQQYVSLKVARNTGVWVKKNRQNEKKEISPIVFSEGEFVNRMNAIFSYYNKVRLLSKVSGKEVLEIDYNDSLRGEGISDVMQHIGIPQKREVSSSHKKVIEKDYTDIVKNWDDAKAFLRNLGVDENMRFFDFYNKVMGS
ncbi:hypothetical protein NPJ88_005120 [Halomonas elongata]|uniref:hypothetical protein n=1 Tax=Halomonas elongata TaxID=2746 RepID=UPI00255A9F39|nr:hypothetical protein [Halomonas elongata]MDL4861705.1 hypothetical protein [Halomonas elongata]